MGYAPDHITLGWFGQRSHADFCVLHSRDATLEEEGV
jgi:hypothetical protein